jgi:small subunit ribosomal protein S16
MIRLQTIGRRNQRSFRLIVTPKFSGPRGKPVEILGSWNPRLNQASLKKERISYWMARGAKSSPTAHNLFVKYGVIQGKKIPKHKVKKSE